MTTALNPDRAEPTTFELVSATPVPIGTHRRYRWTKWAWAIGVIITLPAVGELRKTYPQSAITYKSVPLGGGPVKASVIPIPMLLPAVQPEVPSMLFQNAYFAHFSGDDSVNNSVDNFRQLANVLADAYGNALMHDASNADLEAKDLLLETASIRFSSRMLYEITKGSCQLDEDAAIGSSPNQTCVLDDESVDLKGLTDMLSYAAFRLENLGRSLPPADRTNGQRALVVARMGSMEHLYRMVFALSRIHLDAAQSGVYLDVAREQLTLARKHMEIERSLCACSNDEYAAQLQELSELGDQLKNMRKDVAGS